MQDHGIDRTKIKELLLTGEINRHVVAKGWVRTNGNKNVIFITLNDGSTIQLQVVIATRYD
jgi:aspartyl/asparaginyl-tRNA synthetase